MKLIVTKKISKKGKEYFVLALDDGNRLVHLNYDLMTIFRATDLPHSALEELPVDGCIVILE